MKSGGRRYSNNLDDMGMAYANGHNDGVGGEHRKIDINPSNEKSKLAGGNASTVLSSFPLLDSITLLIIFLQLPSTVLTIIHFLFATMTFVPPSTTLLSASTTSSIPSFTTLLLQGSAGSPSLLTVIFADFLMALLSIFLWPSARLFVIDFAQAVMAISLGAGNTGQTGGTIKNAAVCAGVISGAKVISKTYNFDNTWALQSRPSHSGTGPTVSGFSDTSNNPASWIRNAIAIHIVAQGVMRALRGWLTRRPVIASSNEPGSPNPTTALKDVNSLIGKQKDKDPESGTTSQAPQSSSTGPATSESHGRRKRKGNTVVRSRQPLWAALASTIVHIAKEVEQSQAVSEAANLEDDNSGGGNGGEHKGLSLEGRVWITNIGSAEISFGAGHFPPVGVEEGENDGHSSVSYLNGVSDGKNVLFPFFVRVNGIPWPQTDIYKLEETDGGELKGDGSAERRDEEWIIDISGLTPATEYDFEFVRSKLGKPIYQTSACTMPAQGKFTPCILPLWVVTFINRIGL